MHIHFMEKSGFFILFLFVFHRESVMQDLSDMK